ncbi:MAG: SIMPL domain-containing protein [bacterium]
MEENKECCMGCAKPCMYMKYHGCKKIFAIIMAIVLIFIFVKACDGRCGSDIQKDTIVVSGKGELTVKPDIANVSFSVMEESMDVAKASDAVNTKMAKIIESLKTNGVDEKDIKTTGYNIYPRYDYVSAQTYPYNGKQVLAGYDVTQSISLKIRDLTKAGKVVTDLGTLGVTDMSGLNFTNDKYDDLVKQARDEAITQARSEAKKLAKALGVRLVKIVGYSEGGNYPVYYDRAVMSAAPMSKGGAEAVLPTGENKITSNISITYEIK